MRKNIYLILLSCLLWLSFSILYSFSESNGGGTGSGGSSNGAGEGGWDTDMSGYRFTIVDRNFNAVKINGNTSIDILYSKTEGVPEKYKNARVAHGSEFTLNLESGKNEEYVWTDYLSDMELDSNKFEIPHYPIDIVVENRKKKARTYGKEFYDWMLSPGKGEIKRMKLLINAKLDKDLDIFYFNMDGFKEWRKERLKDPKLKDMSAPSDYMAQMHYNLVVEPIVWFLPESSRRYEDLSKPDEYTSVLYKNKVYGTVSNFVEWFLVPKHVQFGIRDGKNQGGQYSSFVARSGKGSLHTDEDVYSFIFNDKNEKINDKLLMRNAKSGKLDLTGGDNTVEELKEHMIGSIGEKAPYGYAMHIYWFSKKPTPPPKIIPKPTPQPDHKYGLKGHIVVSSDEFDVSKEQPVDENVKISAFVNDPIVLFYKFKQVDYTNTYNVTFIQPYSDGKRVSANEQYVKSGTYYEIEDLSCFRIKNVDVFSKSLLDMDHLNLPIRLGEENLTKVLDKIDIYQKPSHIKFGESYYEPNTTNSVSIELHTLQVSTKKVKEVGKDGKITEKVEKSYPAMEYSEPASMVNNDHIQIGEQIMMDGKEIKGTTASAPVKFNGSGQAEFRLNPYKIPIKIPNAKNPTTGDLLYELVVDINASIKELKPEKIKGNDVYIFTPVGISFKINERPEFDQRHDEDELRKKGIPAFPINRVLKFDIDTKRPDFEFKENQKGAHYKRPDGRDTVRFMDYIDLVCGFDAYVSTNESDINDIETDKKFYYEADENIILDKNTKTVYIKPANWAAELENSLGAYAIAKNHIAYKKPYQWGAYENIDDHEVAAGKRVRVDIVGRLFHLKVNHVDDPNWIENYDKQDAIFITGLGDLNGKERKPYKNLLQLPVRNGKNLKKGHQNLFPRLGYKIEFSVRTMGDFYYLNQLIGITPKYYVLDKETNERVEVDLYYRTSGGYERYQDSENPILIGKNQLHHKYSAADVDDMKETKKIYQSDFLPEKEGFRKLSVKEYIEKINIPVNCNYPDIFLLRASNRVFEGDRFAQYPSNDIRKQQLYRASAQEWYGRFYLPSSVVAVRKDTDLQEAYKNRKKFFIKDGYLIVNFDVNVYSGGERYDDRPPRLTYRNSTCNTWEIEGYHNRFRDDEIWDFQLKYGDVIIFDLSKRATDRLKVGR